MRIIWRLKKPAVQASSEWEYDSMDAFEISGGMIFYEADNKDDWLYEYQKEALFLASYISGNLLRQGEMIRHHHGILLQLF